MRLQWALIKLNTTIADEPQEFDSEPGNSWAWKNFKRILKIITLTDLAGFALASIFFILPFALLITSDGKHNGAH